MLKDLDSIVRPAKWRKVDSLLSYISGDTYLVCLSKQKLLTDNLSPNICQDRKVCVLYIGMICSV